MKTTLIYLLFTILTAFTCNKNSEIVPAKTLPTYAYAQTQCADPWPYGTDDEATAGHVRDYLKGKGVETSFVSIKQTSDASNCLACTCLSGKTIYIGAADEETTRKLLNQIGFK